MYYHIHYLRIVILTCLVCFPSSFVFFASAVEMKKASIARKNAVITCVVYGVLAGIVYGMGNLCHVSFYVSGWIILGGVAGLAVIFIELGMAQLKAKKEFGSFTKIIKPPKTYVEKFNAWNLLFIVLAACFEELLFRQILIRELYFELPTRFLVLAVLISAFLYAINHIYFSVFAVAQKFVSALVFAALFVFSGYNLLIPMVAHCVQNTALYLYGTYSYRKDAKK